MKQKFCKKCETLKDTTEFTKHLKSIDGFYYLCKVCKNAHRSKSTKKYKEDPEKRRIINERFKRNNPGYYSKYSMEWQKRNPEKVRATKRRRTLNGKSAIDGQRRRAAIRQLPRDFSKKEWEEVKNHFNNSCAYCGDNQVNLQMEHVISLKNGGAFTADNIVPACTSCNCSKRDKEMTTWFRQRLFFNEQRFQLITSWLLKTALRNGNKLSDTMVNARP